MAEFFQLRGQVALVTGAGRGIGAGIARRLHAAGARIAVFDRDPASDRSVAAELDGLDLAGDVRVEDQVASAVEETEVRLGPLSILVNNAGITGPTDQSWNLGVDEVREVFDVNVIGPFLFCKAVVPRLLGRGYGRIVNVASMLGVKAGAIFTSYAASKGGVRLLTRAVALHCAEQGYDIRVNTILPGAIHTEMVEGYIEAGIAAGSTREQVIHGFASAHPMRRLGRPHEPADAILFLASDESSFITDADLPVDGGNLA